MFTPYLSTSFPLFPLFHHPFVGSERAPLSRYVTNLGRCELCLLTQPRLLPIVASSSPAFSTMPASFTYDQQQSAPLSTYTPSMTPPPLNTPPTHNNAWRLAAKRTQRQSRPLTRTAQDL